MRCNSWPRRETFVALPQSLRLNAAILALTSEQLREWAETGKLRVLDEWLAESQEPNTHDR